MGVLSAKRSVSTAIHLLCRASCLLCRQKWQQHCVCLLYTLYGGVCVTGVRTGRRFAHKPALLPDRRAPLRASAHAFSVVGTHQAHHHCERLFAASLLAWGPRERVCVYIYWRCVRFVCLTRLCFSVFLLLLHFENNITHFERTLRVCRTSVPARCHTAPGNYDRQSHLSHTHLPTQLCTFWLTCGQHTHTNNVRL